MDVSISQAPEFVDALKYMAWRGAQFVMHGYTHQYAAVANPFTAVSGDDYEFFRVTLDAQTNIATYAAVPEDSTTWVQSRLTAGLREFTLNGLNPVAWEAPHYAASALDYRIFATNFPLTIQRVLYFDASGHNAGQFFPYTIERDVYGQKLLPENLGNVDPYGWHNYGPRLPADLIRAARKNRVLRDGWASCFFHPYLDVSYLRELVTGIKALGYTFVPLNDSVRPTITSSPQNLAVTNGARVVFNVQAVGTAPLKYQWRLNGTSISWATNATLTISNAQAANAGTYTVVVTNTFGSATSDAARLQVATTFTLSSVFVSSGACSFYLRTQSGVIYTVEFKNDLAEPRWQTLKTITGNGTMIRISDSPGGVGRRFYRVGVE
jgi:hypothetical protein